ALRNASTTLPYSTRNPSPVVFTSRPLWAAIAGSITSARMALSLLSVPASSDPISREYPATSAARIAARRRVVVTPPAIRPCEGLRACGRGLLAGPTARDCGHTGRRSPARSQRPVPGLPALLGGDPTGRAQPRASGKAEDNRGTIGSLPSPS